MENDVKIFETVDQFVLQSKAVPEITDASRLQFLASAIDMLAKVPDSCRALLSRVLAALGKINLSGITFNVTDRVFSEDYRNAATARGIPNEVVFSVLLQALQVFLDAVENGAVGTPDLLWRITLEIIDAWAEIYNPKPAPAPPAAAEICSDRLLLRCFKPRKVTFDLLRSLDIDYVFYQPEISPGSFGHDIRGLAFRPRTDIPKAQQQFAANALFILLETGEHIVIPKNALNLASINDPEDYEKISPSLLVQAIIAAPLMVRMGVIPPETASNIEDMFGQFASAHAEIEADAAAMLPLEQVFVQSATGMGQLTGPSGASVRFPIADPAGNPYAITLNARLTPTGHYLVSNLAQTGDNSDDIIVMKNDYPRQLSPYGVYVFPREDCLFSLAVFPHNFVFANA